jgi:hypothetical protein
MDFMTGWFQPDHIARPWNYPVGERLEYRGAAGYIWIVTKGIHS